jgi:hypothetical protein
MVCVLEEPHRRADRWVARMKRRRPLSAAARNAIARKPKPDQIEAHRKSWEKIGERIRAENLERRARERAEDKL